MGSDQSTEKTEITEDYIVKKIYKGQSIWIGRDGHVYHTNDEMKDVLKDIETLIKHANGELDIDKVELKKLTSKYIIEFIPEHTI